MTKPKNEKIIEMINDAIKLYNECLQIFSNEDYVNDKEVRSKLISKLNQANNLMIKLLIEMELDKPYFIFNYNQLNNFINNPTLGNIEIIILPSLRYIAYNLRYLSELKEQLTR